MSSAINKVVLILACLANSIVISFGMTGCICMKSIRIESDTKTIGAKDTNIDAIRGYANYAIMDCRPNKKE